MLIINFRSVSPPDPDVTAGYFRTAVMIAPQAYHAKPALSRLLGGIDDRNVWRADLLMLGAQGSRRQVRRWLRQNVQSGQIRVPAACGLAPP